jgi:hypothetical protein
VHYRKFTESMPTIIRLLVFRSDALQISELSVTGPKLEAKNKSLQNLRPDARKEQCGCKRMTHGLEALVAMMISISISEVHRKSRPTTSRRKPRVALTPVGLSPTVHARLHWTQISGTDLVPERFHDGKGTFPSMLY